LKSQDIKGLTPLHLAVKMSNESESTKLIKQLLVKGADRNMLDYDKKKPIDFLPEDSPKK
jgi:ankyrin repeat protein